MPFVIIISSCVFLCLFFFFQAEDGIRDVAVTGVQTCALPISLDEHLSQRTLPFGRFAGRPARAGGKAQAAVEEPLKLSLTAPGLLALYLFFSSAGAGSKNRACAG